MTALQAAFAHAFARPHTRKEKRQLKAKKAEKRPQKDSQAPSLQIQKLLELAHQIDADHASKADNKAKGFHRPEETRVKRFHAPGFHAAPKPAEADPSRPRPHTTGKLTLPAYPRKTVKPYITATTGKMVDMAKLEALPRIIPHFEASPQPKPPSERPNTARLMAEFENRLNTVIAAADAARQDSKRQQEAQGNVGYLASQMV